MSKIDSSRADYLVRGFDAGEDGEIEERFDSLSDAMNRQDELYYDVTQLVRTGSDGRQVIERQFVYGRLSDNINQ